MKQKSAKGDSPAQQHHCPHHPGHPGRDLDVPGADSEIARVLWVILTSFRGEKGSYVSSFFPKTYTLDNYIKLFTDTTIPSTSRRCF